MNYEEILELRKQHAMKNASILNESTFINQVRYHFTPTPLFDEIVYLHIPEEFIDMPFFFAKNKYPSDDRPKIIKTNSDTTINLCFNHFDRPVNEQDLQKIGVTFFNILKQLYPSSEKLNSGTVYYDRHIGRVFYWYSYKGHASDGDTYNFQAFLKVDNTLFQGVFNCRHENYEQWQKILIEMFSNIDVRDKESKR